MSVMVESFFCGVVQVLCYFLAGECQLPCYVTIVNEALW